MRSDFLNVNDKSKSVKEKVKNDDWLMKVTIEKLIFLIEKSEPNMHLEKLQ